MNEAELEIVSIVVVVGGLVLALLSNVLGAPRRDSSLYPFIAAIFCFFAAVPYASYVSGGGFLVSLLASGLLFGNES